jgi:hypothetical protein
MIRIGLYVRFAKPEGMFWASGIESSPRLYHFTWGGGGFGMMHKKFLCIKGVRFFILKIF